LKKATGNSVNMRVFLKKRQVLKAPQANMLTFIIVIEFSVPKAKIIK